MNVGKAGSVTQKCFKLELGKMDVADWPSGRPRLGSDCPAVDPGIDIDNV